MFIGKINGLRTLKYRFPECLAQARGMENTILILYTYTRYQVLVVLFLKRLLVQCNSGLTSPDVLETYLRQDFSSQDFYTCQDFFLFGLFTLGLFSWHQSAYLKSSSNFNKSNSMSSPLLLLLSRASIYRQISSYVTHSLYYLKCCQINRLQGKKNVTLNCSLLLVINLIFNRIFLIELVSLSPVLANCTHMTTT